MEQNAIVVTQPTGFLAPVINVDNALAAYQAKKDLIDNIMKDKVDYGVIPGTSKPTLLKAGAEKATSFFGLHPVFKDACVIEDWTGDNHGGEPFFYYRRTCELYRNGEIVASVDGSCNSWEKKYRYRTANRKCPVCNQETIIKGKEEYGGGWLCFRNKGGCGAKFKDGDKTIEDQYVGQIKNPDVAETVNTILKMADKRALIAATLIATGMSEYFTQDVEDYVNGEYEEYVPEQATAIRKHVSQQPATVQNNGHKDNAPTEKKPERPYEPEILKAGIAKKVANLGTFNASDKQIGLLASMLDKCFAGETNSSDLRHAVQEYLTGYKSCKEMPGAYVKVLLDWLDAKQDNGGDYSPSAMAVKEAQAIRRQSLIDAGQMDLLAEAEKLGGHVAA